MRIFEGGGRGWRGGGIVDGGCGCEEVWFCLRSRVGVYVGWVVGRGFVLYIVRVWDS